MDFINPSKVNYHCLLQPTYYNVLKSKKALAMIKDEFKLNDKELEDSINNSSRISFDKFKHYNDFEYTKYEKELYIFSASFFALNSEKLGSKIHDVERRKIKGYNYPLILLFQKDVNTNFLYKISIP